MAASSVALEVRKLHCPSGQAYAKSCDLEDWLPITAGAHWSHHFDRELPMRGDVLVEPPQLVRDSQAIDWQLELRLSTGRSFRLSQNDECNRLQLAPVEVGSVV
jgi:hypothetical protein